MYIKIMKNIADYFTGLPKGNEKRNLNYLPEKVYKICLDKVPIACVDVIIFNKEIDKVLLFKRNNNPLKGIYYSIGGRVLKNEHLINTALRKLKDEAGVNITETELYFGGFMEEFYENSVYHGIDTHNINIFFSYISQNTGSFNLDYQHSKCRWFNINSKSLHPHIRKKIDMIINKENNYCSDGFLFGG